MTICTGSNKGWPKANGGIKFESNSTECKRDRGLEDIPKCRRIVDVRRKWLSILQKGKPHSVSFTSVTVLVVKWNRKNYPLLLPP